MKKIRRQEIWLAISCAFCVVVAWPHLDAAGASEFTGGTLTGPLFEMAEYGIILFLLAVLLTPFYRRITTVMALSA
ncbi:MAG TPA: hypothetical protein VI431_12295, partial [Candidatus Acidoferrum sp.]